MKKQAKHNKLQSKIKGNKQKDTASSHQPVLKLSQMTTIQHHEVIATNTQKLLIEPEKNINGLVILLNLTKSPNIKTCILALDSLSNVFTSVSPLQSINMNEHQSKLSSMLKKDQYQMINFQAKLVESYKKYLDIIKELTTKLKPQFFQNREVFLQFKRTVMSNLIKCTKVLWNFNYNNQLLQIVLKYIKHAQVQETLRDLLSDSNPSLMKFKVAIIKSITTLIIKRDQKTLPSNLVQIINSVQLDSRYLKKTEQSEKYKNKKKKRKQYKEKQIQKKNNKEKDPLQLRQQMKRKRKQDKEAVKKAVNKQFAEGEININKRQIVKQNSDILQQLFYLYFKMITRKSLSVYLKSSLDGILKFCHLISTDLLQSLIMNLNQSAIIFVKQWETTQDIRFVEASLYIIFSSESVINGPASLFNMLDVNEVCNFYKILRSLNKNFKLPWSKQMFRMTIKILHQMFIRKRQLSNQVIGSFVREILILCTCQMVPIYAFLQTVRQLAFKYHKVHKMFQEDNQGFGINSHNPHINDPQSTNAIYTSVLPYLQIIKKKFGSKQMLTIIKALTSMSFKSQVPKQLLQIVQQQQSKINE